MDLLESLLEDLRSPDSGVRYPVLSRLETLAWTPELAAALRTHLDEEQDPGTRFHIVVLLGYAAGVASRLSC